MSEEQKLKISQANKGRKYTLEHRKKLSEAHKGHTPTNLEQLRLYRKGRPLTEEHKRKISEAQKGRPKNLTDEARRIMSDKKKGKPAWNKGMKGYNSGCKNSRWIKDRSKVKTFEKRIGSLYSQHHKACLLRDNFTCQMKDENCSGRLEVHHIKRWQTHPELRYEISNGITLCHEHHRRLKNKEEQFEEYLQSLIN